MNFICRFAIFALVAQSLIIIHSTRQRYFNIILRVHVLQRRDVTQIVFLKGIKWRPDENGVIAFDCRNRKWYIQAATSPKDVVILVDVSGSMKGLRLTIARQTVSSILDTLGDDDFFNIIAVSSPKCVFITYKDVSMSPYCLLLSLEEMLGPISSLP